LKVPTRVNKGANAAFYLYIGKERGGKRGGQLFLGGLKVEVNNLSAPSGIWRREGEPNWGG